MGKRSGTAVAAVVGALVAVTAGCGGSTSQGSQTAASPTARVTGGDALTVAGGLPPATPAASAAAQADLGFKPETDAFSFPNYGGDVPATNLTSVEMRALFGDGVCAAINGPTCDLIPPAQDWMNNRNKGMNGGHCQGMSVTALLFYKGVLKPSDYGAANVPGLALAGNDSLQRRIAQSWAFQNLPSVVTATVHGTPSDIVDALAKAFSAKGPLTFGLGIYKPDRSGGHEITPYAVVDHGGGKIGIMVYDNNFPQVPREVTVDRTANTWTYTASTNPNEPGSVYAGDATTNTLEIDPVEPGVGVQPCPFCAAAAPTARVVPLAGSPVRDVQTAVEYEQISLEGNPDNHAHLLITDGTGHRLGYTGGTFVDEIPGALAEFAREDRVWKESEEPVYMVPVGSPLTIAIDGSALSETDTESVSMIGPAVDLNVDNIDVAPGQKDAFTISADRKGITYVPGGKTSPLISIGTASATADYAFSLQLTAIDAGTTVEAQLAGAALTTTTSSAVNYDIEMLREDSSGGATFKHAGVSVPAATAAALQYGGWQKHGDSMALVVSGQTTQLSDQG